MRIEDAQQRAKKVILELPNSQLKVDVLLAYVLGKNKEYLLAHNEEYISKTVFKKFENLIYRHLQGEPIEYLINNKEFYGINLYVDKRALIPRPETEFLVDMALDLAKTFKDRKTINFADIGTGSGNIAIAIAQNLPEARVLATDISKLALEVASKNIEQYSLKSRVQIVQSDMLREIQDKKVDIMIANLPYIGRRKNNFVAKETLDYEPEVALFGGDDGLILYNKLFSELKKCSSNPSYLLGEIGFTQKDDLLVILSKYFDQFKFKVMQDLSKSDRYFIVDFTK